MKNLNIIILLLIVLVPRTCFGEDIELICNGEKFIYDIAFGASNNTKYSGRKFIYIDTMKNIIKTETFFGDAATKLNKSNEYYSATFIHNNQHKNAYISKESLSIDRYTGDVSFVLDVNIGNDNAMYGSFNGKCQKAIKMF